MTANETVGAGWFAGADGMPPLVEWLAGLLDQLAARNNWRYLVVGGGAAGFAVLSLLGRLRCEATGLVWNPETSLARCEPQQVVHYLQTAFPGVSLSLPASTVCAEAQRALASALSRTGIEHDQDAWSASGGRAVLYLQDAQVPQRRAHAGAFMRSGVWRRAGGQAFVSVSRGVAVTIGRWGRSGMPAAIVDAAKELAAGGAVDAVAMRMDREAGSRVPVPWFHLDGFRGHLGVAVCREGDSVQVSAAVDASLCPGAEYDYAFQLLAGGQRINALPYGKRAEAAFPLPPGVDLKLLVLARDGLGNVVRKHVPLGEP